jgi:hypothetical protein
MRAVLAILLVPAFAAAGPKFSTTISADAPFADGVVAVRAKLDACWRKEMTVKVRVTVTAGAVKDIELVEVDPKAPLPCVTKALRAIKLDAATNGVFETTLQGEAFAGLLKTNLSIFNHINTLPPGSFTGLGTGTSKTGVGPGMGGGGSVQGDFVSKGGNRPSGAPKDVQVQVATPDGTAMEIDRVIRARAGVFRACYQKELVRSPKAAGKIAIKFSIDADGSVTKATVGSTSMNDTRVEACLRIQILRLKFPASVGPANITYPFLFSQGG